MNQTTPVTGPATGVTDAGDTDGATTFAGRRGALFRLALVTSVLTVLTLGIYRFWMKTRLRRYYWSSVRPAGSPVEYVGEPLEKLLGFLIAVVFLAFYLGIVNLLLVFASFSLLQTNVAAYVLSFIGVIPLWFYAAYRARRYVLARTRWRGIRFGLAPGAVGYAWRALGHWLAVLVTLGLAWPRMTFWLEKYRTDRTFFGTLRLHQGGDAAMLYPAFVHLLIGGVFSALTVVIATADANPRFLWLLALFLPWAAFGLVHYRVRGFALLTGAKTAGPLGLVAQPRVGRVARIWILGGLLALVVPALIAITALGIVIGQAAERGIPPERALGWLFGGVLPESAVFALGALLYFALFLSFGVLRHVFLTLPLSRHYAETLTVTGTAALPGVAQRTRDDMEQAEGFAEALDVGAAI